MIHIPLLHQEGRGASAPNNTERFSRGARGLAALAVASAVMLAPQHSTVRDHVPDEYVAVSDVAAVPAKVAVLAFEAVTGGIPPIIEKDN